MNEKLTAYVLNELPPDERAELEAQMKTDPALREQAEEMKVFCTMLSAEMAGEESPALTAQQRVSVMRAFTSEAPAKKIVRPFWRQPAFLVPTAIAACVAFALVWDGNRTANNEAPLTASAGSAKEQLSVPVQVSQPKAERRAPAPTTPKPAPAAPEKPRVEIAAAPAPALPTVAMGDVKKESAPGEESRIMKAGNKTLAVSNPVPATPAAPLVTAVEKAVPTPPSLQSRNRESLISKDAAGKPLASVSKPAASKQFQLPPIVRSFGGGVITFNDPKAAKTPSATPPGTRASFPYLADASTLLSPEFNDSARKRRAAGFGNIAFYEPDREPVTLARSGLLAPQALYDGGGAIVGFDWLSTPGILGTWERNKAHMASAPYRPEILDAGNGNNVGTVVLLNSGTISVAEARITAAGTSMPSTKVNLGRTFTLDKGLSTKGLTVGQAITGNGVTPGTVIIAINNGSTFTTNQGALKSGTADLEYGAVSPRNGTLVSSINQGNATVTVPSTVGLTRGQSVKGAGIPEGAAISSIVSGTQFTLTATATQSDARAPLTYSSETIFGGKLKTTTTSGARIVVASTLELTVGQPVSGNGIPADSKITGILDDNTFEISSAVTSTGTETLSYGTSQGLAGSLLATTTAGNSVVKVPSTAGLSVGQAVTGLGIPDGTHVDAIRNETEFELSAASLFTGTSKLAVAGSEIEVGKSPSAPANLVFNGGIFTFGGTGALKGASSYMGGMVISGGALSTTGSDLSANRYQPALTPAHSNQTAEAERNLEKAYSFYHLGDYNNSLKTFQHVLRTDPYNSAARRGMERVEQKRAEYFDTARDHMRAKMLNEVNKGWEDAMPGLLVSTGPGPSSTIGFDTKLGGSSVATRADAPLTLNGGALRYTGGAASPAGDADKKAQPTAGIVDSNGFIDFNGKADASYTTPVLNGNLVGDLTLGNQSRSESGNSVVHLSGHKQIADNTSVQFGSGAGMAAANGGNNSSFQNMGFSETIGGIADFTGSGVIENTEGAAKYGNGISLGGTGGVTLVLGGNIGNASGNGTAAAPPASNAPADPFAPDAIAGGRPADDSGATGAPASTAGVPSSPSTMTKAGAGTLVLSGTSTYTGATIVNGGALRVTSGRRLDVAQTVNGSTTTAVTSPGVDLMSAPTATTRSGQSAEITIIRGGVNGAPANHSPLTVNSTATGSATINSLDISARGTSGSPIPAGAPAFQTASVNGAANTLTVDGGSLELVGGNSGGPVTRGNRSGNAAITPDSIDGLLANPAPASTTAPGNITAGTKFDNGRFGKTMTGVASHGGTVVLDGTARPAPAAAAAPTTSMAGGKDLALATDKKKENTFAGVISGTGGVQATRTFNTTAASAAPPAVGLTMAGAGDVTVVDKLNAYNGTTVVNKGTLTVGSTVAVAPAQPTLTNGIIGGWATTDAEFARKGNSSATANSATPAAEAPLELQGGITVGGGENTYQGGTTVSGGILNISHSSALGTVAAGTVVSHGASLELQGGAPTIVGGAGTPLVGSANVAPADRSFTLGTDGGNFRGNNLATVIANQAFEKTGDATLTLPALNLMQAGGILITPAGPGSDVTILQNNPDGAVHVTIVEAKSDEERQQILREQQRLAERNERLRREQMEQERREADLRRIRESSNETYTRIYENPFLFVAQQPLSTFSIDVDSASYANVRRFLNNRQAPPPDAVRLEELINYFPYAYEGPGDGKPFGVMVDVAEAPWQPLHRLVRVALKGREVKQDRGTANFVFLVDVSGSMSSDDKLPLVKQSLQMLTRQLGANDRVALVVYAGSSGLVLPSTPGTDRDTILEAIGRMQAGGSTNGAGGITQAYQEAAKHFVKGGVNRVILCTDGDFNVGISSPEELEKLITEKAKSRIFLSVLGFGTGNLKDRTMETLADKGNGNYAYIDSLSEARKVLVEQMNGTLVTIAKDVKIQVEFNPTQVAAYRLLGYENRLMAKEDFNNDKKDAGEIGAGHTVTALYEVVPATVKFPDGRPMVDELKYAATAPKPAEAEALKPNAPASNEMMTVKLRYKQPEGDKSDLLEVPVTDKEKKLADSEKDFQFAASVAGFGMLLRGSQHAGDLTWDMVREMALSGKGEDKLGYRGEFLQLVDKASSVVQPRQ